MKVLCILLCVAFANGFYINKSGTHEDKVQGGEYAIIEEVPYHASLLWMRIHVFCGATIIHASWVITASHCVYNRSHISVRTGSGLRHNFGQEHTVERILFHRDYNHYNKDNDIALIKLVARIIFNNEQQPIPPAKPYDIPREGELMRISGFGKRGEHLSESDMLRVADVPVINQAMCEYIYSADPITDNMFCAGTEQVNARPGDSGGPGVIRGRLYGIISSGRVFGLGTYPAVYTRVYKYHDWIEEHTRLRF